MSILLAPPTLIPLADVLTTAPEGQEPTPGFPGWVAGREHQVTAVLERVAVIADPTDRWADKHTIRHAFVLVDPAAVTWRPKREEDAARSVWVARGSPDESEVRHARQKQDRAYREDARRIHGQRVRDRNPTSRRVEAGWRPCSRAGCSNLIHPRNTTGVCEACQLVCPECGGPKTTHAQACRRRGCEARRPLP